MSTFQEAINLYPAGYEKKSIFQCRLCWRVGISIFAAILIIEALILVFSTQTFERERMADIERQGLSWTTTILRVHKNVLNTSDLEQASHELPEVSNILGLSVYNLDGAHVGGFGKSPEISLADYTSIKAPPAPSIENNGREYKSVWYPDQLGAPYFIAVRLDISSVDPALQAYISNSVGLTLFVSIIVTVAAMVVLGFLVLIPIMRLRRQIVNAGLDPDHPDAYVIHTTQNDELGEVSRVFNQMVGRLALGIARNRAQEDALRSANDMLEERVSRRTGELSEANRQLRREASQRQQAEQEIDRLAKFPGENPEPVIRLSPDGTIEFANQPSSELLRAWKCEIGHPLPDQFAAIAKGIAQSGQYSEIEVTTAERIYALRFVGTDDSRINIFGKDITSYKHAEDRIQHLANHDLLTGLPNRTLFNDRLAQVLSLLDRKQGEAAIHLVNLDNFRELNNSMGIEAGDQVLQETADRLGLCVRSTDTVARLGGDEFAIIQSDPQDAHGAAALAEKLIDNLSAPFTIGETTLHITASIGISLITEDDIEPQQILRNADLALSQAKANGVASLCFFETSMNDAIQKRREIENDLRLALKRNEFVLHYQPKVNLAENKIAGMEVLIRWLHPVKGFMSPVDFIPIAESTRQIIPIGAWVLKEACRQAKAWRDDGLTDLKIAVNLSAVQFSEESLPDLVAHCLRNSGLPPEALELEITESVIMNDVENTTKILTRLNALGLNLSIDDFGTGYSSLSYLEKFPVHRVKIDKSFVDGIGQRSGSEAITKAVITLGHSLGMEVTAEGVEEQNQVDYLRAQSCDEIQGYFYSKPVAADHLMKTVENIGDHYLD